MGLEARFEIGKDTIETRSVVWDATESGSIALIIILLHIVEATVNHQALINVAHLERVLELAYQLLALFTAFVFHVFLLIVL